MRICVVAAIDPEGRQTVLNLLRSNDMEATFLNSLGELPAALQQTSVSGILLDLVTAIKASPQEKKAAQDVLDLYPYIKFRLSGARVLPLGSSIEGFLEQCRRHQPRVLRKNLRVAEHRAVHLYASPSGVDSEKSVMLNASVDGCFVFSVRNWHPGDRVWLRFEGENEMFSGTVCSVRPWGNNRTIPGIGIQLDGTGMPAMAQSGSQSTHPNI